MNPYRVLQISKEAGPAEILQAVTRALQKKEFTAREIVGAQKELMNPRTRKAAEFIYLLDIEPWIRENESSDKFEDISDLPLLSIFDKFIA